MSNNQYFTTELKPTISFMSWFAIAPFIVCTVLTWFPILPLFGLDFDVLLIVRLYSAIIVSFVAGSVWSAAFLIQLNNEKFDFNRKGLMFGAGLVSILSWLIIFIVPKAGVFISALLFLVLWQIELKSNLAKVYPEWFWTLRTKQTMIIALSLMGIWLTLG